MFDPKQLEATRKKASAFDTGFGDLAMNLEPTKLAIWAAVLMLVAGTLMEFSVALDLFRVHYLNPPKVKA